MHPCFLLTEHSSVWNTLVLRGGAREICLWLDFKNLWNNVNSDENFPHAELVDKMGLVYPVERQCCVFNVEVTWEVVLKETQTILEPHDLTYTESHEVWWLWRKRIRNQRWWTTSAHVFRHKQDFQLEVPSCSWAPIPFYYRYLIMEIRSTVYGTKRHRTSQE